VGKDGKPPSKISNNACPAVNGWAREKSIGRGSSEWWLRMAQAYGSIRLSESFFSAVPPDVRIGFVIPHIARPASSGLCPNAMKKWHI
jgi:hypothetical protein